MSKSTKQFWMIALIMLSMVVLKLLLVSSQQFCAMGGSTHDDSFFLKLGENIASGNWLGEYNNMTLTKGSGLPIWLAMVHWTKIPLLWAQRLLYTFCSLLVVLACMPLIQRQRHAKLLGLLAFAFVLFCPSSYTPDSVRILRVGLYFPLTMAVFAGLTGMITWRDASGWICAAWAAVAGVSMGAALITREEGIWLYPAYALALLPLLWQMRKSGVRILIPLLPALLLPVLIQQGVCMANYRSYGVWQTVELKKGAFSDMIGTLNQIPADQPLYRIPVSKEVREKAYAVSPSFKRLEPYLDGAHCEGWRRAGEEDSGVKNEFAHAFFLWGLRDAAQVAGIHDSAHGARDYYQAVADELRAAHRSGQLELVGKKQGVLKAPSKEEIGPSLFRGLQTLWAAFSLQTVRISPYEFSIDLKNELDFFRRMTHEKLAPSWMPPVGRVFMYYEEVTEGRIDPDTLREMGIPEKTGLDKLAFSVLNGIAWIYRLLMPGLLIGALIIFFRRLLRCEISPAFFMLMLGLLGSVALRSLMLGVLDVTSFRSFEHQYIAPAHAGTMLLIALAYLYVPKGKKTDEL